MFGGEFLGWNSAYSTVSKDAEKFQKIFGHYIIIGEAELLWTFWIQICRDYHLNSIYISYCCFWLFVFCSVIMYAICVYCKFMCIVHWTRLDIGL